jgi:hypothetical protein
MLTYSPTYILLTYLPITTYLPSYYNLLTYVPTHMY